MFKEELSSKDEMIADLIHTIKQITQKRSTVHTEPIPVRKSEIPNTLIHVNTERKENCNTDRRALETVVVNDKNLILDQFYEFKEKRREFYAFKN